MAELSRMPQVRRVAAQTNLSWPTGWLDACEPSRIAFWCTFHPGETSLDRFLARCAALDERAVSYSVGVVGKREHLPSITALRAALHPEIYLWINAYRDEGPNHYAEDDLALLQAIDPLFGINRAGIRSRGRACATGESVISVDGDGEVRRCHSVKPDRQPLRPGFRRRPVAPRPCPLAQCRCHIGYAHMPHLGFRDLFGDGLLERALPIRPAGPRAASKPRPAASAAAISHHIAAASGLARVGLAFRAQGAVEARQDRAGSSLAARRRRLARAAQGERDRIVDPIAGLRAQDHGPSASATASATSWVTRSTVGRLPPRAPGVAMQSGPGQGIESREGFVEEQHLRGGDEGAGDRDALLLARLRQVAGPAPGMLGEADALQGVGDTGPALGLRQVGEAEGDVVGDAEPGRSRGSWNTMPTPGCGAVIASPSRLIRPALAPVEPGDQAQQGGLAAARAADQRHDLAGPDLEREVGERPRAVGIGLRQAIEDQHGACVVCGGGITRTSSLSHSRPHPEVLAIVDRRLTGASKEGSRSLCAHWSPPSRLLRSTSG